MEGLKIENLEVSIENKQILKGINLEVKPGEVSVIMGPNGSGKSSLANTIMGHPDYKITSGKIFYNGEDITELSPDKRAKKGLFLSFQYPSAIPGVSVGNFLRVALNNLKQTKISVPDFKVKLTDAMIKLNINPEFSDRSLNDGFSGGEKKKAEILQMAILEPKTAILDETDSGLDIDALKIVAKGINDYKNKERSILLITHYQRILDYITPDKIHVLLDGKIIKSGDSNLSKELETKGYDWLKNTESLNNALKEK